MIPLTRRERTALAILAAALLVGACARAWRAWHALRAARAARPAVENPR